MSGVVLDNFLFIKYINFLYGGKYESRLVENIISYMKDGYITNAYQLKKCLKYLPKSYAPLAQQIMARGNPFENLVSLAVNKSKHKIILTHGRRGKGAPYVNILSRNPELAYTMTCFKGESRKYLIEHIKNILKTANRIVIRDKYIKKNFSNTCLIIKLSSIFPDRSIALHCLNKCNFAIFTKLSAGKGWVITKKANDQTRAFHDRYIIVDDKYEILISSGFYNLFTTDKEVTCIFREKRCS